MFQIRQEQRAALAKQFTGFTLVRELASRGYQTVWHETSDEVRVTDPRGNTARLKIDEQGRVSEETTPLGRKFRYGYDAERRLTSIINPAGTRLSSKYDERDFIKEVVREPDRRLAFQWDKWGNLSQIDFPDQTSIGMTYRELDRFTAYKDRSDRTTQFERNESGLLTAITDPRGNKTSLQYRDLNLPSQITLANGTREDILYNSAGRLSGSLINGEPWTEISWHSPGHIKTISYSGGHSLSFVYDDAGNVIEARNPSITVKRQFDEKNRVVREDQGGQVVEYSYDPSGLLAGLTTPTGESVRFGYDADARLIQVEDWHGGVHTFDYQANDQAIEHRLPNGLTTRTKLASHGSVTEIQTAGPGLGSRALSLRFDYDPEDRVKLLQDSELGTRSFSYDLDGQLLRVEASAGSPEERFTYDPNGNRVKVNDEEAEFDSVNLIKRQGKAGFAYDARGNLVEESGAQGTTRYAYNGQNLLVAVDLPDGRRAEFAYDAFARRISKTVGKMITRYVWAADQLICELTDSGAQPERRDYLYFPRTHIPLAVRVNGIVHQYHTDPKGTPRWLTDSAGRVVWSAAYSAFGGATCKGALAQNLRFPGQYFDEETGIHYNRARYYSPTLGRYLSRDPVQLAATPNLYLYAGNDPVNGCDPLGLLGFWNAVIGGALIVGAVAFAVITAPVTIPALATVLVVSGALAGAGAGVLGAPDNCPLCMLAGGMKGLAAGGGLGMMAAGMLVGGAAAGGAAVLVGGGMAVDAASVGAGVAGISGGLMMMSQASKMSGGEGEGGGDEGGGRFASEKQLEDHFERHGGDFGAKTSAEYEQQADKFLNGPRESNVLEKVRPNGDVVRYNPSTDEFGVAKADGTIRTYYKPDPAVHGQPTNLDYFNGQ